MSLKLKLARMKGHMQLDQEILQGLEESKASKSVGDVEDWSALSGKQLPLDEQWTVFREIEYPLDFKLGKHRFSELFEVVDSWNQCGLEHPLATNGLQSEELLFFDTETTGLGGGTGNTIFLIGYCHVTKTSVKVKQFFLPGPAHEVALYYYFLSDVKDLSNLVTYNGKAFDWPQVRTRHTFVRDKVPNLPLFGHFDLLHAARRLWKHQLPSCRLSIVEKEILGIERINDTPGSLAPLLYFDYLKERDPKIMEGVMKHNETDVLSLISLYIHLSKKLLSIQPNTSEEKYEIARWFEKMKQTSRAIQLYEEVANSTSTYKDHSLFSLGMMLKKEKQMEQAQDCFYEVSQQSTSLAVMACIELSKLYERYWKDIDKAAYFCDIGFSKQKNIERLVKDKKTTTEIKIRLDRLVKKRA